MRRTGGCLAFLAKTLIKVESKPKPPRSQILKHQVVQKQQPDSSGEDDELLDEEEEEEPLQPIPMRECTDPRLRSEVDRILSSRVRADNWTYARVLLECGKQQALLEGKKVHAHICLGGCEPDEYLCSRLVQMYGGCGSMAEAKLVFDRMPVRSVYTLTTMLSAFARNGYIQDAVAIFETMPYFRTVTWNAMLSGYAQNGYLHEARELFERMQERDVVSWNALLAAYAHAGHLREALVLFRRMDLEGVKPDRITVLHALSACSQVDEAVMVHTSIMSIMESEIQEDIAISTGLVVMYGKCGLPDAALSVFRDIKRLDLVVWTAILVAQAQNGRMEDANLIFERMPRCNVVTWTAMLAGYAQSGQRRLSWNLFRLMDLEGILPSKITFISVLDACAGSTELENGKTVHSNAIDTGLGQDVSICNALISMYGRCRDLQSSQLVFSRMRWRNVVSWSALLASYAQNGYGAMALEIFRAMQMEGVRPNEVTLLSVLSACSHAGFFDEGLEYFVTVPNDYPAIKLAADHLAVVAELSYRSKKGSRLKT